MQLYFKTYCDKNNLQSVRDFVRKSLSDNGITDPDAYMTVLAVDEICANLMIHSNRCDDAKMIDLKMAIKGNQLYITITDYGISFNYDNHLDASLDTLVADKRKGGLGLMLVKRIMDKVTYESFKGKNSWILSKKIHVA
jgi:serine/threonine-protein kinase RsbW